MKKIPLALSYKCPNCEEVKNIDKATAKLPASIEKIFYICRNCGFIWKDAERERLNKENG